MIVGEGFEIVFVDRDEFEDLLVQLRFYDIVLCELNKQMGGNDVQIELLCNDLIYSGRVIKFPFNDFFEALKVAKDELLNL